MASITAIQDRHFRTDHLQENLRRRVVRGGMVTLTSQGARFALHLGSMVVLGRLLSPEDYGLVGMVVAVTGFVAIFKDLGLSAATVQRGQVNHQQVSTLFWINVAVSIVLAGLLSAAAPIIAWFFGEPRLVRITLCIAGTFILGGLTAQHIALLRRQMKFTHIAAIDIGSMTAGIAVALIAALRGADYWALVLMHLAGATANALLAWTFSRWRPGAPIRGSGVRAMLRFGGNLTGFQLVNYAVRNLDHVLIGRWCGAASLGLYGRAYNLLLMPLQQVNQPISSVAVPALSRLQDQPRRYRSYYLKGLQLVMSIGMPLVVATFVLADQVVLTVLGPKWMDVVPLYRVLALAAFVDTSNVAAGWVYMTLGRTDRQFRWQIFESIITIAAFAIGLYWGAIGVAAAFSLSRVALRVPSLMYCYRGTPLRMRDMLAVFWPPALTSLAAGAITFAMIRGMHPHSTVSVQLLIGLLIYGALYSAGWLAFPSGRQRVSEIRNALANRRAPVVALVSSSLH